MLCIHVEDIITYGRWTIKIFARRIEAINSLMIARDCMFLLCSSHLEVYVKCTKILGFKV